MGSRRDRVLVAILAFVACFGLCVVYLGSRGAEIRRAQAEPTPAQAEPTPAQAEPTAPETNTTFEDLLVWRMCSHLLSGETDPGPMRLVFVLDYANLTNDRAKRIAELVYEGTTTGERPLEYARAISQECRDWREEDARRLLRQ